MTKFVALIAITSTFVFACGSESRQQDRATNAPKSQKATVVRVVDGDTLVVKIGGAEKHVRLVGIDTPETHKPGVKVECGGPEASSYMKDIAPVGAKVRLVSDPTQDKVDRYGRLLAYASIKGDSLQLDQLYAGNAEVYIYKGKPFQRADKFQRAEDVARRAKRGVWGHCNGEFHSEQ